jgi:hypothetical protein
MASTVATAKGCKWTTGRELESRNVLLVFEQVQGDITNTIRVSLLPAEALRLANQLIEQADKSEHGW